MKLERADWERLKERSESLLKEATLTAEINEYIMELTECKLKEFPPKKKEERKNSVIA